MSLPKEHDIYDGAVLDFPYSGEVEEITLPKGTYKLECWGAQGGSYSSYLGGLGGYAAGDLTLTEETKLLCRAGGQPATVSTVQQTAPGGFNGGGSGYCRAYSGTSTYGQGGGGASDIRIGQDSLYTRVIVAGGGGGSAHVNATTTKYGGGASGGSPQSGYGATQTAPGTSGSFGQGASCSQTGHNYKYGSGGGGGGWYGGGASPSHSDSTNYRNYNGGGSGFVWTGLNAPDGYLLDDAHYLQDASTIPGNQAFLSPTGTSETGHSGNGHVRITVLLLATEPKPPANFRIDAETDAAITLAWDSSEKADGYRLYRNSTLILDGPETSSTVLVELFSSLVFSVAAYNQHGESERVSLTCSNVPENPILFLITDRTQADVIAQNHKGYYAASDLNRVGCAVEFLAERLRNAGVSVSVAPVTAWTDEDWVHPSAARAYLADVRAMRNALKLARNTPDAPEDMEKLTYTEANDIEAILMALDTHITRLLSIVDASWALEQAFTGFYFKEAYQ